MKNYKLKESDIKHILEWSGPDGCKASDDIVINGKKVGYMFRDYPIDKLDSGWRFFSSEEDYESSKDIDTFKLNTICNYDQDIIRYMDSKIFSYFKREDDRFVSINQEITRKKILDDFDIVDFDYLKIRTNENYSNNVYDYYIHIIERLNYELKLVDNNKNNYIFDNQSNSFLECFTSFGYKNGTFTFRINNSLIALKKFINGSSEDTFSKIEIEIIDLMLNLILFEISYDLDPNTNDMNIERKIKEKLYDYKYNVKQNIEYGSIKSDVSIRNYVDQKMYLENMIFSDYIKYKPISENIIVKYKRVLPEIMIYLWRTKGLGSFYDNYFKIVNPDEYKNIKNTVIFVTGFGEIITIDKYGVYLTKDDKTKRISDDINDFFFDLGSKKFLNKHFEIEKFISLNSIRGLLDYDKIYDSKLNIKSIDEIKD